MNIVLIGFRCAGKSTIGHVLADRLKMTFIDIDEMIEKKRRMTIKDIFERKGETVFRLWESDAVAEVCKLDRHVIATGGGVVLRYKNIRNLKRNSVVVLLQIDPEIAYERIKRDAKSRTRRPALTDKDPFTEVVQQCRMREPIYRSVSDIVIDTTDQSVDRSVERIVTKLKEFRLGPPEGEKE